MKILETYDWNRRDFSATLQCESCEHKQTQTGCYDDFFYHNNVIPDIKCKNCDKSSKDLGSELEQTKLKYSPSQII